MTDTSKSVTLLSYVGWQGECTLMIRLLFLSVCVCVGLCVCVHTCTWFGVLASEKQIVFTVCLFSDGRYFIIVS